MTTTLTSAPATPRLLAGRYELGGELLRCRFSTLYSAVDLETLTPLVVRRLNASPRAEQSQDAGVQFVREANLLRRLRHRNLPHVLDHLEDQGEFFILMEQFDGYTLDYVVGQLSGPPQEELLRRWMEQVAAVLEFLHAQSPPIVYRDLRPETILITRHAIVKLVDFGLARLVLDLEAGQTLFRRLGEEFYAAPEQLLGRRTDPRVDLYALGATFYHLAARGAPPPALERVHGGAVVPSLAARNPFVSPDFEALLNRLMALDPEARPASATEVRAELRRLAGTVDVPAAMETRTIQSVSLEPLAVQAVRLPGVASVEAVAPVAEAAAPAAVAAVEKPPSPAARRPFFSLRLPWLAARREEGPAAPAAAAPDLSQHPLVDLSGLELDRAVGLLVPEAIAQRVQGICIGRPSSDRITLAVKDPTQVYIYDHISYATRGGLKPVLVRAEPALIDLAQEYVYRVSPRLHDVPWMKWLERKRFEASQVAVLSAGDDGIAEEAEDVHGPAVEAVDRLIKEAISIRASDIHVETYENEVVLRYRIDGILHVMDTWPRTLAAAFVKRIKLMANMDIAQTLVPQGGRISVRVSDREFDLRVSCLPVPEGECIVMRLLDKGTFRLRLSDLGMTARNQHLFGGLVAHPHGMMLVSGPTGSGKSTTLYAALAEINRPDRKILTVEDPIEYRMAGVVQVQVNVAPREEEKRLTFARALREFLRHDPDVILVGEIRDDETAAISVQAALTGHLVLSTIHTNDALGIITRLRERGVEPFLISSTLIGGVAQRLVRTICEDCRVECEVPEPMLPVFEREGVASPRMFRGEGCLKCHRTGYRGRLGLYEVMVIDDEMRGMIARDTPTFEMLACAQALGMRTLLQDGLQKVAEGVVSLEEVQRVCMEA